ncbi:MAG TPA: hypothetical protein VKE96_08380, partial [Vicinamibacterales bacterium]|nr:hypothetical protein [Vicinamibacterales bacterium]
MRFVDTELIGVGVVAGLTYLFLNDWIPAASLVVLWLCIKLTATHDHVYALPMAMGFQWSQTSLGVLYYDMTGRSVPAIEQSDYRPMVLLALGCCLALAAGIKIGLYAHKAPDPKVPRPGFAFGFSLLVTAYVASIFVEGSLVAIAPNYPTLRQIITTLDTA